MRSPKKRKSPKKISKRKPWNVAFGDKRGRSFNRQFQGAIHSVYQYFKQEKRIGHPLFRLSDVRLRTATALKCSLTSVSHYLQRRATGAGIVTPGKNRPRKRLKRDVDTPVKNEIRNIIYEFSEQRIPATLDDILKKIREKDIDFQGKKETLRKVLRDIGFAYVLRNGCRYLMEEPYIIARRKTFLKEMKKHFDEGTRDIVYQDETWTMQKGTGKRKAWEDKNGRSSSLNATSAGNRFIICHAGSKDGFIEGAGLFIRSGKKASLHDDYHGEMNSRIFRMWIERSFLPRLRKPSVIVFDNAAYHSKLVEQQPTTKWDKLRLQVWLKCGKIEYEENMTVKQLLALCKKHRRPSRFEIDEHIANTTNHVVVRLPPYHPFYNAIELAWGIAKPYYDKHIGRNDSYSEQQATALWQEALNAVTPAMWARCCEKVKRRILEDYNREVGEHEDNEPAEVLILDEDFDAEADVVDIDAEDVHDLHEAMELLDEVEKFNCQTSPIYTDHPTANETTSARKSLFTDSQSKMDLDNDSGDEELAAILTDDEEVEFEVDKAQSAWESNDFTEDEIEAAVHNIPGYEPSNECDEDNQSQGDKMNIGREESAQQPVEEEVSSSIQDWLDKHDDILISHDIEDLYVRDLKTLKSNTWLNDVIMNIYMNLIVRRSEGSVFALPTFFFNNLPDYKKVQRWTRKVDIFSKKLILIPINFYQHWTLCVVNVTAQSISYYDSMGGSPKAQIIRMQKILGYLEQEYRSRKNDDFHSSDWIMNVSGQIPQQENSDDCGVFACQYAEYLTRDAAFDFTADSISVIRARMMSEIISSKLTTPLLRKENDTETPEEVPKTSRINRYLLTGLNTNQEVPTRHAGVYHSVSASSHQADLRFPEYSRNKQCTAISTFCIVAFILGLRAINTDLLDYILLHGDQYYVRCRSFQKLDNWYLDVEDDLLRSFTIFDRKVDIKFDLSGEGEFQNESFTQDVVDRINIFCEINEGNLDNCGFLFIASAKTVAFFILPSAEGSGQKRYYLFNPHCVDLNNDLANDIHRGKARLFRCDSAVSLAQLLLLGQQREKNPNTIRNWQIYQLNLL